MAEKLKSIRLSNTRVVERPEVTVVRNKQCNYNSRSAARGKIRLVENRLKGSGMKTDRTIFEYSKAGNQFFIVKRRTKGESNMQDCGEDLKAPGQNETLVPGKAKCEQYAEGPPN